MQKTGEQVKVMKKRNALLLLLLVSANGFAASAVDFYTYGGFETVVDGFKRIALIFNSNSFIGLFAAFVAFGVIGGAAKQIFATTNNLAEGKGTAITPASLLVPVILGATILKGIITPTAVVHIYDDRKNAYESVAGVPVLIAYIASGMNLIERSMIDTIDANSALPYGTDGGGISFKLLYSAMESASNINAYDMMNMKRYFEDCGQYAIANSGNDVDANEITSNTDDLSSLLAEMTSSSVSTVMYNSSNKSGVTATCTQAYTGYIKTFLDDADTTSSMLSLICKKSGFDASNPVQLNACTTRLETGIDILYQQSGAVDAGQFIRGAIISQAIAEQITDEDPDSSLISITNKTMMTNGLSTAIGSQEWYDTIKANLTIVVLGITPILTLLFVTPLVRKAFPLMFSLFGFITLWGIIDAYQHQAINDAMMRTVQDIQNHKLGLKAFWLTPNATAKALSILGDSRSQALTISAALSSALFGLSAYGLSGIGQNGIAKAENAANESGQETLDPVNSSKYLDEAIGSQAIANTYALDGYGNAVDNRTFGSVRDSVATQSQIKDVGAGSAISAATAAGQVSGGKSTGDTQAYLNSPSGSYESARSSAETNAQENIGNAGATRAVAANHGQTVTEHTQQEQTFNKEQSASTNAGIKDGAQSMGVNPHELKQEQTAKQTVLETGETDVKARNMDLVRKSTGNAEDDTRAASRSLAQIDSPTSKIIAAEGDTDKLLSTQVFEDSANINQVQGQQKALRDAGIPENFAAFSGGYRTGANGAANANVVNSKSPEQILDAAKAGEFESVNRNVELADIANKNGGIDTFTSNLGAVEAKETKDRITEDAAKENIYGAAGIDRDIAASASGSSAALSKVGEVEAQNNLTTDERIDAAKFEGLDREASNLASADIAKDNGGLNQYVRDKGEIDAAEKAANVDLNKNLAETLDVTPQELAFKRAASDVELAINSDDAIRLANNGLMTDQQAQSVIDNDGGKFDGSINKKQEQADLPNDYYVSAMMTGAEIEKTNSGYVINDIEPHQAQHFFNQGQITEDQYQSIINQEGGSLMFETTTKDSLTSATSRVFTGDSANEDNSTSIDRGFKFNDQNAIETSAYVGNEDSARVVATDGEKLNMALRGQDDKATLAASIATAGLSGIYATEDQVSNVDSLSTSGGLKTPDAPATAGIDISTSTHETENERINSTYGTMYQAYTALDAEADHRGFTGDMKDEWVADEYARLNQHILSTANNRSVEASSNEAITNGVQNYMGDMGYKVAEENIDSPNFLQYKPGNTMNNLEGKK